MDMRTMMALRRVRTPTTPITKSSAPNAKYKGRGTTASSISTGGAAQHLDQLPGALWPLHWLWRGCTGHRALLLESRLTRQEDGTHHGSQEDQRGNLKGHHKIGKQ